MDLVSWLGSQQDQFVSASFCLSQGSLKAVVLNRLQYPLLTCQCLGLEASTSKPWLSTRMAGTSWAFLYFCVIF